MEVTRQQSEESFRSLSSVGLSKTEIAKGKNGKDFMFFNKTSVLEIAENPKVLEMLVTLGIRFSQCEECHRNEMISPIPQIFP